jgi:hypothetical protein
MNKSDQYFRELDQAWNRAQDARLRQGVVVRYITHWYRDEDGDVIMPYANPYGGNATVWSPSPVKPSRCKSCGTETSVLTLVDNRWLCMSCIANQEDK